MDFFIPVISVIGFGETGSLIASLINQDRENIEINILDPSDDISGRVLDLKNASIPQKNKIHLNNTELLSKSQLIFYTAGVRGSVGEERSKKATESFEIIKNVFHDVSLKDSALIVSISNPLEATAQWIQEVTNKQCKILCTGTLLDTYRLTTILSDYFNVAPSLIQTAVVGEHGSNMFPLWSQTKIAAKKIKGLVDTHQLELFTKELKNTATKIRQTESATKYGVAQTALFLANQYFSHEVATLPLAFSAKEFIGEDLYVNWNCHISRQHIIPTKLKLQDEEKELWQSAVKSIRETTALRASKST